MHEYDDTQRLLSDLDASVDCAEAHGILCGILSLDTKSQSNEWLGLEEDSQKSLFDKLLASDNAANSFDSTEESALSQLATLHRGTRQQLIDTNYDFSPLLPDDNESINVRTQALSHWCQGFLFGLSISGLKTLDVLSDACREIVEDFNAIAQLSAQYEEGEDEEAAYMELVEYLRVGTFTLVDEHRKHPDNETLH